MWIVGSQERPDDFKSLLNSCMRSGKKNREKRRENVGHFSVVAIIVLAFGEPHEQLRRAAEHVGVIGKGAHEAYQMRLFS